MKIFLLAFTLLSSTFAYSKSFMCILDDQERSPYHDRTVSYHKDTNTVLYITSAGFNAALRKLNNTENTFRGVFSNSLAHDAGELTVEFDEKTLSLFALEYTCSEL